MKVNSLLLFIVCLLMSWSTRSFSSDSLKKLEVKKPSMNPAGVVKEVKKEAEKKAAKPADAVAGAVDEKKDGESPVKAIVEKAKKRKLKVGKDLDSKVSGAVPEVVKEKALPKPEEMKY